MVIARQRAAVWIVAMSVLGAAGLAWGQAEMRNLALHQKATASASEEGNPPQNAVDGDMDTRWCNDSDSSDAWWQVDLKDPQLLGGCEINWEHDGAVYRYVVEGSTDGKTWTILNDQRGSHASTQLQKLALEGKEAMRYVRIKFTELDDGSWASFFEVKIFDAESMKKLSPEAAGAFAASSPLKAPTTAPAAANP